MMQHLDDATLDLLCEKAVYGLSQEQANDLENLEGLDLELRSLELTAAAIAMAGVSEFEPMPESLSAKIMASAAPWVAENAAAQENVFTAPRKPVEAPAEEKGSVWNWLGWAVAAVACVALAFNIFTARQGQQIAQGPTQSPAPTGTSKPSLAELRERLIASGADIKKATWGKGNVAEIAEISGDVVWSDSKQEGYMRFRGLPKNDPGKETYQLWIFEDGKLEPHPKDGGVFDVTADGEVIIPIDPKLATRDPKVFAVTIERPGGVVVSKREKIAALAKTETATS